MEPVVEKEFTALGGLFQHIITDLKNSAPVWEDFLLKASKFHSQLKSTILTSSSFLDSFQKIADMATNTRGATKEIGSALTRLCLRQRSVEQRLKIFSNSLQESLILPLQDKLEEWKKTANNFEKEHSKEYKRAKQELKKKSSDTLRLQKKVRKVGIVDIRRTLDYALQDVTDKYLLLEEMEKQSVRKALIEERAHYCIFVGYLQPVLESEMTMIHEINHLEEIIDTLSKITGDPHLLPSTSEQVISDMKSTENTWSFQTPPSSPGSLGSRKSSVCSISSVNSSSSGSLKSHSYRQLSHCQKPLGGLRNTSVASRDSGFTSQDTLFLGNSTSPFEVSCQVPAFSEIGSTTLSTPSSPLPSVTSTWPNLQETEQFEIQPSYLLKYQRPHTISSAYEKSNHNRPALTARTFQPLDHSLDTTADYSSVGTFKSSRFKEHSGNNSHPGTPVYSRPSIPERNEDIERRKPTLPEKSASVKAKHGQTFVHYGGSPNKSLPDFNKAPADQVVPHPVYANTSELASKIGISGSEHPSPYAVNNKELQNQRDLAAVLTEGLLLQSMRIRNDNSPPSVPSRPKNGRPIIGSSETLPRSRGSICEEDMLHWQMYATALCNAHNYSNQAYGNQRRPASVAGISAGLQLPRKANTLQRVGSSPGNKPPTPVRRSSSITTSSSQPRISEGGSLSFRNSNSSSSVSSGAGEVCYSPNLKEMNSGNVTPQGRSYSPLKRINIEKNSDYECTTNNLSVNGADSDPEQSIVTDVSDSRARLIQDLNLTLQNPKKVPTRKASLNDAPIVPPRHSSKQDQCKISDPKPGFCAAENAIYGRCGEEKRTQTFNAKPVLCQDIAKHFQRKPSITEIPQYRDLILCKKEQSVPQQRHVPKPAQPLPVDEHPSEDKSSKQNFMAALNAKLAQHQQQNNPRPSDVEKQQFADWHARNSRNSLSRGNSWETEKRPNQPLQCRESLMDQIKRGKSLRRVTCNDRSSPRIA